MDKRTETFMGALVKVSKKINLALIALMLAVCMIIGIGNIDISYGGSDNIGTNSVSVKVVSPTVTSGRGYFTARYYPVVFIVLDEADTFNTGEYDSDNPTMTNISLSGREQTSTSTNRWITNYNKFNSGEYMYAGWAGTDMSAYNADDSKYNTDTFVDLVSNYKDKVSDKALKMGTYNTLLAGSSGLLSNTTVVTGYGYSKRFLTDLSNAMSYYDIGYNYSGGKYTKIFLPGETKPEGTYGLFASYTGVYGANNYIGTSNYSVKGTDIKLYEARGTFGSDSSESNASEWGTSRNSSTSIPSTEYFGLNVLAIEGERPLTNGRNITGKSSSGNSNTKGADLSKIIDAVMDTKISDTEELSDTDSEADKAAIIAAIADSTRKTARELLDKGHASTDTVEGTFTDYMNSVDGSGISGLPKEREVILANNYGIRHASYTITSTLVYVPDDTLEYLQTDSGKTGINLPDSTIDAFKQINFNVESASKGLRVLYYTFNQKDQRGTVTMGTANSKETKGKIDTDTYSTGIFFNGMSKYHKSDKANTSQSGMDYIVGTIKTTNANMGYGFSVIWDEIWSKSAVSMMGSHAEDKELDKVLKSGGIYDTGKTYNSTGKASVADMIEFYSFSGMKEVNSDYASVNGYATDPYFKSLNKNIKSKLDTLAKDDKVVALASNVLGTMLDLRTDVNNGKYSYKWGSSYNDGNYIGDFWKYYSASMVKEYRDSSSVKDVIPTDGSAGATMSSCYNEVLNVSDIDLYCYMYIVAKATEGSHGSYLSSKYYEAIQEMLACAMYGKVPMGANLQFVTGNVNTSPSDGSSVKWASDAGLVPYASYLVCYEDLRNYAYQLKGATSNVTNNGAYYLFKQQRINNLYAYKLISDGVYGGLTSSKLNNDYDTTYSNSGRTGTFIFPAVVDGKVRYYAVGSRYMNSATNADGKSSNLYKLNPWSTSMYSTDGNYMLAGALTMGKYPTINYGSYPMEMPTGSIIDGTWTQFILRFHVGISKGRYNSGTWQHRYDNTGSSDGKAYVNGYKEIADSIGGTGISNGNGVTAFTGSDLGSGQKSSSVLASDNGDTVFTTKGIPEYLAIAMNTYYHTDRQYGEDMFKAIAGYGGSTTGSTGFACGSYIAGSMQGYYDPPEEGKYLVYGTNAEMLWTGKNNAPASITSDEELGKLSHELKIPSNTSSIQEKAVLNLSYSVYRDMGTVTKITRSTDKLSDEKDKDEFRLKAIKKIYGKYKSEVYVRIVNSKDNSDKESNLITENSTITSKSEPKLKDILYNVKSTEANKAAYNIPIKLTKDELYALFNVTTTGQKSDKAYTGYYLDFSHVAVNIGESTTNSITPEWLAEQGLKIELCTKKADGKYVSILDTPEANSETGIFYVENGDGLSAGINISTFYVKNSSGQFVYEKDKDIKDTIAVDIKNGAKAYTYGYAGAYAATEIAKVKGDASKTFIDGKIPMTLATNYYKNSAKTVKRTTDVHKAYLQVNVGAGVEAVGQLRYEDSNQHTRRFNFPTGDTSAKAVGTPVYVDLVFNVDPTKVVSGTTKTIKDVLEGYYSTYESFGISAEAVTNGSAILQGTVVDDEIVWQSTSKGKSAVPVKLLYSASDSVHTQTSVAGLGTPAPINKEKFKQLMQMGTLSTGDVASTTASDYMNFFFDWNSVKVSLEGSDSELPGNYKYYGTIKIKLWGKKAGSSTYEALNAIMPSNSDGNYMTTGFSTAEGENTQMYVQGSSTNSDTAAPYPVMTQWYNIPETFAEIKEGNVNYNGTGSSENYDAMSGVPSTEKLYFTSGGSEFVVEISTALMQGEKTTRTYTSKFNQVTDGCEFMLGDQLHGGTGITTKTTEWGRNGNSYILNNSSNKANTKETEWYNLATPVGASSYNITVNEHKSDTVIKAEWEGTITNTDSSPSANTNAVGYNPGAGNNALSDMDNIEANSNAKAGTYGEPGSMGTERNSDFNWNVDSYNTALTNAYTWAKAMENASATAKGNIAKLANSDGVTRSYHSGEATITIKVDGISVASMADEQKNKQANGTWSGTTQTTTTGNYSTYLLKSHNDSRLGTTWREDYGAKAVRGAYGGCIESGWEYTKYQARPMKTITYIASYSGSSSNPVLSTYKDPVDPKTGSGGASHTVYGINCTHAPVNATFQYRDSWCGATSYTKTDATHTMGSGGTDSSTPCSTTSGSYSVHTCTHSAGSWASLVETKAVKMQNPTYKIVVTFKNNYVESDAANNVKTTVPTSTIPAHALCGPCCEHTTLPTVYDKWQQQSEYDYLQIVKLNVYKISRSYLEGGELSKILYNEDENITAKVIQGEPNIYYNIAAMNDTYRTSVIESKREVSLSGRARYSLQPQQHDSVTWDEKMVSETVNGTAVTGHNGNRRSYDCDGQAGTLSSYNPAKVVAKKGHENAWSDGILYNRTDNSAGEQYNADLSKAYTNYTTDEEWFKTITDSGAIKTGYSIDKLDPKDKKTYEYNRFNYRRNMDNTMYAISDMLILQTSTGDQTVLYYQKENTAKTQQHFTVKSERALRWTGDDSETVAKQAMDSMWKNNNNSVATKSVTNWIANGGYLGLGGISPTSKFSAGSDKVEMKTIFDSGSSADSTQTQTDPKANVAGPVANTTVISITDSLDPNLFKSSPNKADNYELRMSRNNYYRVAVDGLQINPIIANKGYNTGNAYQGYMNLINYTLKYDDLPKYWKQENGDGGSYIKSILEETNRYNDEDSTVLNGKFYISKNDNTLKTTECLYAAGQNKINNIIIHTPVSAANAMVKTLEDSRDQRTDSIYEEGFIDEADGSDVCPRTPGDCEFAYLDCKYFEDNVIYSTDFEDTANVSVTDGSGNNSITKMTTRYADEDGVTHIVDTTGKLDLSLPTGFEIVPASFSGASGNALKCNGTRWRIPLSSIGLEEYNGNNRIKVEMNIKLDSTANNTMVVSFNKYDFYIPTSSGVPTFNTGNGWELQSDKSLSGASHKLSLVFDFYNIEKSEAYIDGIKVNFSRINPSNKITSDSIGKYLNIGSWNYNDSYPAQFTIDNLVITKLAGVDHHTEACYTEVYTHKESAHYTCQVPAKFNYTGKVQTFTAPQSGYYMIEAYGASGGHADTSEGSAGGKGGYTGGKVYLSKGEKIDIYVGGQGTLSTGLGTGAGWNGGGNGGASGYGGGGMTHVSYSKSKNGNVIASLDSFSNNGSISGTGNLLAGYTMNGENKITAYKGDTLTVEKVWTDGWLLVDKASNPLIGVDTSLVDTIEIRIKNNTGGSVHEIHYGIDGTAVYGKISITDANIVSTSSDGYSTYRYTIDKSTNNLWGTGKTTFFRLDLCNGGKEVGSDGTYELDYIKLMDYSVADNVDKISANGSDSGVGTSTTYSYTGNYQAVTLEPGIYKLEAWGAQGGGNDPSSTTVGSRGGTGGYTSGTVTINSKTTLYIYVGGQGDSGTITSAGGYNGGGNATWSSASNIIGAGGGATDFRITNGAWNDINSLRSRVLVAGGGGGADDGGDASGTYHAKQSGTYSAPLANDNDESGGDGGGINGGGAVTNGYIANYGFGTQTTGGIASTYGTNGGFGYGGVNTTTGDYGGGGGGYYGGCSGGANYQGGGGGSSYAAGHSECDTTYSSYQGGLQFTNVQFIQGGNKGNGKAVITKVGSVGKDNSNLYFDDENVILAAGGGGGADNAGGAIGTADDGSGGYGGGLTAGNASVAGDDISSSKAAGLPNIDGLVTKTFDGATWARVLYQDISANTNYFTSANYLSVNQTGLFSCLGRLPEFKSSSKYEFLLEYPDATGTYVGQYNRWKQTNSPLDEKTNGGSTMTTPVTGYEAVHVDWNPYGSGGLEFNGSASVLDGSVGFGNWWVCVGIMNTSYTPTNTTEKPYTMPGIPYIGNNKVALWVRVDGLTNGTGGTVATNTNGGGCGLGGTQTSGYAMGKGESATFATDTGGAGGGYYGGYVTNHNNGGAGGGSGYLSNKVSDGVTKGGANIGDGYVTITLVDHVHNASCTKEMSLNNSHTHTADCIEYSDFLESLLLGAYTTGDTSQLTKYLGNSLTGQFVASPTVLKTITNDWKYVTKENYHGTITTNGNLKIVATDWDPFAELDVQIKASAVKQIKIDYTASGLSSAVGSIYFDKGVGYNENQRLDSTSNMINESGTLTFNTSENANWDGSILGLRLDLPNGGASAGTTVTVTKMEFIGYGSASDITTEVKGSERVLYTYENWTSSNMLSFGTDAGYNPMTLSGNNLLSTINASAIEFTVPTNIDAKALTKIRVTLDNNTAGTTFGIFPNKVRTNDIFVSQPANTANSVVTVDVTAWASLGKITSLQFDTSAGYYAGNTVVKKIELIGTGTATTTVQEAASAGTVYEYNYTGGVQSRSLPAGKYKIEMYGAQGAPSGSGSYTGSNWGYGGYSTGELTLGSTSTLNIYVGGAGSGINGGFNGGGYGGTDTSSTSRYGGGGGGASDIRLNGTALTDRIIVAAGGGGGGEYGNNYRGNGGGTQGYSGIGQLTTGYGYAGIGNSYGGGGASQSSGGYSLGGGYMNGSLGLGGHGDTDYKSGSGGGGGGYYGGAAGYCPTQHGSGYSGNGGGGSGYVDPSMTNASTSASSRTGNGYVKLTVMSTTQTVVNVADTTYTQYGLRITNSGASVIGSIDGTKASVNNVLNIIKANFSSVPVMVDGNLNPLFTCYGLPTEHVCTAECKTPELVLNCNEPHHTGQHYDKSNPICWSACLNDANHKAAKDKVTVTNPDGTAQVITRGNFINTDYKFSIYYPNTGDFFEDGSYGHTYLAQERGKGYTNGMDTTRWLREKRVKFEFDVLYNNTLTGQWEYYKSGQWISLPIATTGDTNRDWHVGQEGIAITNYDFYCLLSNDEIASSKVEYAVEAINCNQNDISKEAVYNKNEQLDYTNSFDPTNRTRTSGSQSQNGSVTGFTSNHGAYLYNVVDVVGRIGNLLITDTEDLRFCNFFKKIDSKKWIVEPIINEVYEDQQARYIAIAKQGDTNAKGTNIPSYDVRGVLTSEATKYFNTWGTQDWIDGCTEYYTLPLSSDLNNITQLRDQQLKAGYNALWEITTIGNYNKLQVAPYFYAYDTKTGTIAPIDIWYKINNSYRAINIYNLMNEKNYLNVLKNNQQSTITDPKWTCFKEYGLDDYILSLDWISEKARRGFTGTEQDITSKTALMYGAQINLGDTNGDGLDETATAPLTTPFGNSYTLGTLQLLTPSSRARTFIGSENTLSENFNGDSKTDIADAIADEQYGYHAQRWHLKLGLPSSAEFVLYDSTKGHVHPLDYVTGTEVKNMDVLKEKNGDGSSRYVILMTADIKSIGSIWNLQYDAYGNVGQRVSIRGKEIILPADVPNVLAVYDAIDSSLIDVQIIGTH